MDDIFFAVGSSIYKTTNWASCICAIWILVNITLLRCFYPEFINRVSLRLQTMIAIIDLIRHLVNISNNTQENSCKLIGFIYQFCYHIDTFLNVAIAFNLQVIYLQEKIPNNYYKRLLFSVPILAALILDLIPFIFNGYGHSISGRCGFNKESKFYRAMGIVLLYITNYPGLIYCFIICILVRVKLALTTAIPDPMNDEEAQNLIGVQDQSSRYIVSRVSLYPLTYFLCHLGQLFASFYFNYNNKRSNFLTTWDLIGTSLIGTVNMFCFLLDPYILYSWYQIRNKMKNFTRSERTTLISSNASRNISYISSSEDCISEQPIRLDTQDKRSSIKLNTSSNSIFGAKDPAEQSNEVCQSTDLHLHPKYFFRTNL